LNGISLAAVIILRIAGKIGAVRFFKNTGSSSVPTFTNTATSKPGARVVDGMPCGNRRKIRGHTLFEIAV